MLDLLGLMEKKELLGVFLMLFLCMYCPVFSWSRWANHARGRVQVLVRFDFMLSICRLLECIAKTDIALTSEQLKRFRAVYVLI